MVSLRGFVLDKPSGFRGQGSLEYLLVIGVVILITAIVIGAVSGVLTLVRLVLVRIKLILFIPVFLMLWIWRKEEQLCQ